MKLSTFFYQRRIQTHVIRDFSNSFECTVEKLKIVSDSNIPSKTKLQLYAYYKQATTGPPPENAKQSMFDLVSRAKYDSWYKIKDISSEEAKSKYVEIAEKIIPLENQTIYNSSTVDSNENNVKISNNINNIAKETSNEFNVSKAISSADTPKLFDIPLQTIILHKDGNLLTVSLHRPMKQNAFNMIMWEELKLVFQAINFDPTIRVVILTSSNIDSNKNTNFSSGMDLSVFLDIQKTLSKEECEGGKREVLSSIIKYFQESINALELCQVPVIAMITGNCIGGALDVIAACDLRYCSNQSVFSLREVDLGIVADLGSLQRLPHIIGDQRVRELAYTGRNINGQEAEVMGLVLKCLPDTSSLIGHVKEVAKEISEKSPLTIRGIKKSMLYARDHTVSEGLQQVRLWNSAFMISKDLQEAMRATMTKEKPNF